MLDLAGLTYESHETTSETFVEEFVNSLDPLTMPYSEFVLIGGDGLFCQFANAIYNHPASNELFRFPIGLMPGGSQNALCCDLGGKDPSHAVINILRGSFFQGDMILAKFRKKKKDLLCSIVTWGITGDIVKSAEPWRGCLGPKRYAACGAKKFICSCKMKHYNAHVYYKNANGQKLEKKKEEDEGGESESEDCLNHSENEYDLDDVEVEVGNIESIPGTTMQPSVDNRTYQRDAAEERKQSETALATINDAELDSNMSQMSIQTYSEKGSPKKKAHLHRRDGTPIFLRSKTEDINQDLDFWNQKDWEYYYTKGLMFLTVVTHEMRSSLSNEVLAPFSRIDDGRMYIMGIEPNGKVQAAKFLNKMMKSNHVDLDYVKIQEATEVKIEPCSQSFFNIDGEIFRNDHITLEHKPALLRLFGIPWK